MTNSPMRRATLSCLLPPADDSPWAPPLDSCDVVVRLETAGITDSVAQHEYGYRDAWGLAEACFRWLRTFPTSDARRSRQSALVELLTLCASAVHPDAVPTVCPVPKSP